MSTDEKLDELERYYHEQLTMLQESYRKAAEPIIAKLLEIRNVRPQRLMVTLEPCRRSHDISIE